MTIAPGHMAKPDVSPLPDPPMQDLPAPAALGPKGAPFSRTGPVSGEFPLGEVTIRVADIVRLQPGDRIIAHADGQLGMGAAGADQLGRQLRALLKLDELSFDVPVVVVPPGLRVEVLRPS